MSDYGLEKVHDGESAQVDIVFLHGLRGNKIGTWTKDGVTWPRDLLPTDIPQSRVFLFGYDSGIAHRNPRNIAQNEIHSDADDLCAKLSTERSKTKTEDRPIVFVAHSLGGLVAAQALVHGNQRNENSAAECIARNLRGMLFLGTPFKGSAAAKLAETARKILTSFGVDTQKHTLKLLGVDSTQLDELTRAFASVLDKRRSSKEPSDRLEAFFFYELCKTGIGGGFIQIVEPDSAQIMGCGETAPIYADHHGICKFSTPREAGYELVVAAIRKTMMPLSSANTETSSKVINVLGKAVNVAQENIVISGSQTINM